MATSRKLLNYLKDSINDCMEGGGIVVAALPTGYGKTSIVRHYFLEKLYKEGIRIAHVLPLRAVVRDAARKAAEEASKKKLSSDFIGFQAGIVVDSIDKSPYMARDYMIATIDSFLLSFYGIPVYEMFRREWHSDAAFTLARSFDALILDEYHLMVSGDTGEEEDELELIIKQATVLARVLRDYLSLGRCIAILTATLPPSLLSLLLSKTVVKLKEKPRSLLIAYGNPDHNYIKALKKSLSNYTTIAEEYVDQDENFKSCGKMKTLLLKTPLKDREKARIPDIPSIINILRGEVEDLENSNIFVVFNSWRRAFNAYMEYSEWLVKELNCKSFLLTGKMTIRDRKEILKDIEATREKGDRVCLFSTQVVEAGIDTSFEVLITEAAPAPALVQRAGRISRYSKPSTRNAIVVMLDENGGVEELIRGVYDAEATRATIDALRDCGKSYKDFGWSVMFEWRCSNSGCDAWSLVLEVDKIIAEKISNITASGGSAYSNMLEKYLVITQPPRYLIESLEDDFKGSFIRKSALIPLVPIELIKESCENICKDPSPRSINNIDRLLADVVAVDTKLLARHHADMLCECSEDSKKPKAAALFTNPIKRDIIIQYVDIDTLINKPLKTMWDLSVKTRSNLIGFVLAKNKYREKLGLKPP